MHMHIHMHNNSVFQCLLPQRGGGGGGAGGGGFEIAWLCFVTVKHAQGCSHYEYKIIISLIYIVALRSYNSVLCMK